MRHPKGRKLRAADKAYVALRAALLAKEPSPFTLTVTADQLHLSVTPVRDAFHRLLGEGLVESAGGGGFQPRRQTASSIAATALSHGALFSIALRRQTFCLHDETAAPSDLSYAERALHLYEAIASAQTNQTLAELLRGLTARLAPVLHIEAREIDAQEARLSRCEKDWLQGRHARLRRRLGQTSRARVAAAARLAQAINAQVGPT